MKQCTVWDTPSKGLECCSYMRQTLKFLFITKSSYLLYVRQDKCILLTSFPLITSFRPCFLENKLKPENCLLANSIQNYILAMWDLSSDYKLKTQKYTFLHYN